MSKKLPDFAPWHIKTYDGVQKHMLNSSSYYTGWKVNKDGTVNTLSDLYAPVNSYKDIENIGRVLIVKYRRSKNFTIISPQLTSLWGCPDICSKDLELYCASLKSLEHITPIVEQKLLISCSSLQEFNVPYGECGSLILGNIGTIDLLSRWKELNIRPLSGFIYLNENIILTLYGRGLLNLCLLSQKLGNGKITYRINNPAPHPELILLQQALAIINKYSEDILECQEHLFSAELKKYAKF